MSDVLLYDRLVIPVPPIEDMEAWAQSGWEPEELKERLGILGKELVRQVPWTQEQRTRFQMRYTHEKNDARRRVIERLQMADEIQFDAANIRRAKAVSPEVDPMFVTRLILADHANARRDREFVEEHPDVYVEAFAAYPSFDALNQELGVQRVAAPAPSDIDSLAGVFGWEFFVPEDSALSDEDLLHEAASLARKKTFREARADFHNWRRELLEHGADARTALADMQRKIERYQDETAQLTTKKRVLNAFTIIGGAASLAASFVFPPIGAAGGFLVFARLGAEKLLPGQSLSQEGRRGAMCADARKHLGWDDS